MTVTERCPVHSKPEEPTIRCTCGWTADARCMMHSGPRCTCDTDGWTTDAPGNWGIVPIHWHIASLHDLPERREYRRTDPWDTWTREEAEAHAKRLTGDDTAHVIWLVSCPDNCVWDLFDMDDIEGREPYWTPASADGTSV